MTGPTIHVGVISWEGYSPTAHAIADALAPHADRLTTVYSNRANTPEDGSGHWVGLDVSKYYGPKLETLLHHTEEDVLLVVHADTDTESWPALLDRAREVLASDPSIAIWTPHTDYSPYGTDIVSRVPPEQIPSDAPTDVITTDGIVVAYGRPVVDRLRALRFEHNNLGWGADLIAAAHCLLSGCRNVHDPTIAVRHPKGSGYNIGEAREQMQTFLEAQTSPLERSVIQTLLTATESRRAQLQWHERAFSGSHLSSRDALQLVLRRLLGKVR